MILPAWTYLQYSSSMLESFSLIMAIQTHWLIHTYVWHCVDDITHTREMDILFIDVAYSWNANVPQITPRKTILRLLMF